MKGKRLSYILLLGLISALFFSFSSVRATSCSIGKAVLAGASSPIVTGQNVVFGASVDSSCVGQTVNFTMYGVGGLGDFVIKKGSMDVSTAGSVTWRVSVSESDIAGRNSDVTAYVAVQSSDGSKGTNSDNFTIKHSSGACQLTDAKWSTTFSGSPILGSPLHMIVTGTGCAGYGVSFVVYSDDVLSNYQMDQVNGTFDSTGQKLDVVWKANNSKDNRPLASRNGDYNFYYYASAGGAKVKSPTILVPTNSDGGCLNCRVYGSPMSSVLCADGTNISGPFTFSSAVTACKDQNHLDGVLGTTITTTNQKYSCKNNACVVDPQGTMDSTCNYQCAPATDNQSYQYVIDNPLAGGPQTPFDIINIATKWLLNLSIPIAVMFILYAGYLLLTAGPDPGKVKQARGIITNVVLALAIIFIGRGFITLIYSIIELGGPTTTTATCVSNVCSSTSGNPGQACKADSDCVAGKGLGGRCTNDKSCKSGLICGANNLCQTQAGNVVGDPCLSGGNCKLGLVCDLNQTQQVDGQTVGSCANR